jgi:hypothetical protein
MTNYPPVLSFGGGVNSTALAILLVNEGWRGHIVFSDTGTEWPDTYCFMDYFEREWLKPRGLSITRLGKEWRIGQYKVNLLEYCQWRKMIPFQKNRWCTQDYKVKPMQRWCRANGMDNEADVMLGIALDESWRMASRVRPLVNRRIDRTGCVAIIQAEGLDTPRKSGCYICPFQRIGQWRELWERYPLLFTQAESLEAESSARRGKLSTYDGSGKTTLAMRRLAFESQMELFDDEEYLEYRPCQCHL